MTGSALIDFLITVICLCAIVGMTFFAIPYMSKDATFQKIAKFAIGVVGLILFILAIKSVLFGGGGGGLTVTPMGLIQYAIALLVIMVVVFIINWVISYFEVPFTEPIQFVIGVIALIALLAFAGSILFGGGFNMGNMQLQHEHHSQLGILLVQNEHWRDGENFHDYDHPHGNQQHHGDCDRVRENCHGRWQFNDCRERMARCEHDD